MCQYKFNPLFNLHKTNFNFNRLTVYISGKYKYDKQIKHSTSVAATLIRGDRANDTSRADVSTSSDFTFSSTESMIMTEKILFNDVKKTQVTGWNRKLTMAVTFHKLNIKWLMTGNTNSVLHWHLTNAQIIWLGMMYRTPSPCQRLTAGTGLASDVTEGAAFGNSMEIGRFPIKPGSGCSVCNPILSVYPDTQIRSQNPERKREKKVQKILTR